MRVDRLEALGACRQALTYAASFESPQAAWDACESGTWMEWLLDKLRAWPDRSAYEEAAASTQKVYDEATASAWKVYQEELTASRKVYDEASASAWKVYDEATASFIRLLVPTVPEGEAHWVLIEGRGFGFA